MAIIVKSIEEILTEREDDYVFATDCTDESTKLVLYELKKAFEEMSSRFKVVDTKPAMFSVLNGAKVVIQVGYSDTNKLYFQTGTTDAGIIECDAVSINVQNRYGAKIIVSGWRRCDNGYECTGYIAIKDDKGKVTTTFRISQDMIDYAHDRGINLSMCLERALQQLADAEDSGIRFTNVDMRTTRTKSKKYHNKR